MNDIEQAAIQHARYVLRESIRFRTTVISEIHQQILAESHDGWAENNARLHMTRPVYPTRYKVHFNSPLMCDLSDG